MMIWSENYRCNMCGYMSNEYRDVCPSCNNGESKSLTSTDTTVVTIKQDDQQSKDQNLCQPAN